MKGQGNRRPLTELPRRLAGGCLRKLRGWMASSRDAESVFTEIYRRNIWGGAPGSICSGGGTHDSEVADAYLSMIRSQAQIHAYASSTFVDLGCGDMAIGRNLIPLCREFVGVDVVKFVIERHQRELGGGDVRFIHADIVGGELPDGDVCFVRQVFQHLSNRQIAAVLPKLRKYSHVYITEHIPSLEAWDANKDKPHGAGIRLDLNSGIDLATEPFVLDPDEMVRILDVPGNDTGSGGDAGIIRTLLYTPGEKFSR